MGTYIFHIVCMLLRRIFGKEGTGDIPVATARTARQGDHLGARRGHWQLAPDPSVWWIQHAGGGTSRWRAGKHGHDAGGASPRVGVDVGNDAEPPDESFHPDLHGLQVVPEGDEGRIYLRVRFGRPVYKDSWLDKLDEGIVESYALARLLTKKQALAAKLYSQSHFLWSDPARFITLISVVETLAEQSCSSAIAVAVVDRMIQITRAAPDLESSERQAPRIASGI